MRDEAPRPGLRLIHSLKSAVGTLTHIARTRLELLGLELQEFLQGGIRCLILTMVTIAFAGLGVVMLSLLLLIVYWDAHRVLVAALLAGIYLAIAASTALALWRGIARRPNPFQTSLEELSKDQQALSDTP